MKVLDIEAPAGRAEWAKRTQLEQARRMYPALTPAGEWERLPDPDEGREAYRLLFNENEGR